jgi:hypothetical protein
MAGLAGSAEEGEEGAKAREIKGRGFGGVENDGGGIGIGVQATVVGRCRLTIGVGVEILVGQLRVWLARDGDRRGVLIVLTGGEDEEGKDEKGEQEE